jgi:hypothetical protein
MYLEKMNCKCGKIAVWNYLPATEVAQTYFCDDCVPRGCTCNWRNEEYDGVPEHRNWRRITKEEYDAEMKNFYVFNKKLKNNYKKIWEYTDEKNRPYPCCEYDYNGSGYDVEVD